MKRINIFWLLITCACVAFLVSCHMTPAAAGAWAAAGTAAVDAGTSQLVQAGVWDPATGSAFSGWAHLIQDTLANATGLTSKLQEAHAQHSQEIATLSAKIPTATDRIVDIVSGGAAGYSATRAHRGAPTPKIKPA